MIRAKIRAMIRPWCPPNRWPIMRIRAVKALKRMAVLNDLNILSPPYVTP